MSEDESIVELNDRVLNIDNESFSLGKNISDTMLVQKVLRSLPPHFIMKVTAIEEVNDIASLKVDELFGSLRTFELNLDDGDSKKRSGVALQVINEDTSQSSKEHTHDENLAVSIILLTKKVLKLRSKFHQRSGNYGAQSNRDFGSSSASSSNSSYS